MQDGVNKRSQAPQAYKWFALAGGLLLLFLVYTALLKLHVLNFSTFLAEQWLLHRPLTRLECTFVEWQNLGDALVSLGLLAALGATCIWLGYRWRVMPYLLCLGLLCVGCEIGGRELLSQPLSHTLRAGMMVLSCPQITGQPLATQLSAAAGIWWNVPTIAPQLVLRAQEAATGPVTFDPFAAARSYPSGHAMRWALLGLLSCWLCARHIKQPVIQIFLMILTLIIAIGGGLLQFYDGVHLLTDTLAGYLLGAAAACCAIGFLILNRSR